MDSHPNSSTVHVGDYEYNTRDLIGHGAFAVVFKGRHRKVCPQLYNSCTHSLAQKINKYNRTNEYEPNKRIVRFKHVLIIQIARSKGSTILFQATHSTSTYEHSEKHLRVFRLNLYDTART